MRKDNVTFQFEYVIDGYPIFPCRFNADIPAVIFGQPICQSPEIAGKSGKPAPFVGSDALVASCRDASDDKRFVDIDAATDWVNNL
jgi:hypothetical protein